MQEPGVFGPWLLATILFLVLLGSGRTLRGRWLGRPPFGAGVALSVALGVMLLSFAFVLLGHLGALGSPWPQGLLALAALIALPGLFWTWQDHRRPAPGLTRGFGLGWFGPVAWLLMIAALALSAVWITGAFGWEGRGLFFERVGVDYEIGRVAYDTALPRDPFLGSEPLAMALYALGAPEASLALSWWLGVALLFGVCGLGWRLHAHGAGLIAAMALAIVLFATDRPLFLAPAMPATVALLAVMILAVESRGRPNWGHSGVAGALGGFALVSDLGAAAMLLPLLAFGPFWCKFATGLDLRGHAAGDGGDGGYGDGLDYDGGPELEIDPGDAFIKFGEAEKAVNGGKWITPLKHTAIGAAGLSLPLLPWLVRNDAWADDPLYGFRDSFRNEYVQRFRTDLSIGLDLNVDYRFIDSDDPADEPPAYDPYLDATEWGLGLGIATGFGLAYGSRRRRRQTLLYAAPAVLGYGAGAAFGDFELTQPSSLALLSVTAGSTLYTMRGCGPIGRNAAFGTVLATGGLAVGLSGTSDCGYWDERDFTHWTPSIQLEYDYYDHWGLDARYRLPDDDAVDDVPKLGFEYEVPKLDFRYEYEAEDEPGSEAPEVPAQNPLETPAAEYRLPAKDETQDDPEAGAKPPAPRPKIPGYRPDVRPDVQKNVQPRVTPGRY